jgi:hypothetical protein
MAHNRDDTTEMQESENENYNIIWSLLRHLMFSCDSKLRITRIILS